MFNALMQSSAQLWPCERKGTRCPHCHGADVGFQLLKCQPERKVVYVFVLVAPVYGYVTLSIIHLRYFSGFAGHCQHLNMNH